MKLATWIFSKSKAICAILVFSLLLYPCSSIITSSTTKSSMHNLLKLGSLYNCIMIAMWFYTLYNTFHPLSFMKLILIQATISQIYFVVINLQNDLIIKYILIIYFFSYIFWWIFALSVQFIMIICPHWHSLSYLLFLCLLLYQRLYQQLPFPTLLLFLPIMKHFTAFCLVYNDEHYFMSHGFFAR